MIAGAYLKLYKPPLKGVCLEWFFPDDRKQGEEFARHMYANCPKEFGWFHQGGSNDMQGGWHLFEFWNYEACEDAVHTFVIDTAQHFNKSLHIDYGSIWGIKHEQQSTQGNTGDRSS